MNNFNSGNNNGDGGGSTSSNNTSNMGYHQQGSYGSDNDNTNTAGMMAMNNNRNGMGMISPVSSNNNNINYNNLNNVNMPSMSPNNNVMNSNYNQMNNSNTNQNTNNANQLMSLLASMNNMTNNPEMQSMLAQLTNMAQQNQVGGGNFGGNGGNIMEGGGAIYNSNNSNSSMMNNCGNNSRIGDTSVFQVKTGEPMSQYDESQSRSSSIGNCSSFKRTSSEPMMNVMNDSFTFGQQGGGGSRHFNANMEDAEFEDFRAAIQRRASRDGSTEMTAETGGGGGITVAVVVMGDATLNQPLASLPTSLEMATTAVARATTTEGTTTCQNEQGAQTDGGGTNFGMDHETFERSHSEPPITDAFFDSIHDSLESERIQHHDGNQVGVFTLKTKTGEGGAYGGNKKKPHGRRGTQARTKEPVKRSQSVDAVNLFSSLGNDFFGNDDYNRSADGYESTLNQVGGGGFGNLFQGLSTDEQQRLARMGINVEQGGNTANNDPPVEIKRPRSAPLLSAEFLDNIFDDDEGPSWGGKDGQIQQTSSTNDDDVDLLDLFLLNMEKKTAAKSKNRPTNQRNEFKRSRSVDAVDLFASLGNDLLGDDSNRSGYSNGDNPLGFKSDLQLDDPFQGLSTDEQEGLEQMGVYTRMKPKRRRSAPLLSADFMGDIFDDDNNDGGENSGGPNDLFDMFSSASCGGGRGSSNTESDFHHDGNNAMGNDRNVAMGMMNMLFGAQGGKNAGAMNMNGVEMNSINAMINSLETGASGNGKFMNSGGGNQQSFGTNRNDPLSFVLNAVKETQNKLRSLHPMVIQSGDAQSMEDIAKAFEIAASSSQFVLSSDLTNATAALNEAEGKIERLQQRLLQATGTGAGRTAGGALQQGLGGMGMMGGSMANDMTIMANRKASAGSQASGSIVESRRSSIMSNDAPLCLPPLKSNTPRSRRASLEQDPVSLEKLPPQDPSDPTNIMERLKLLMERTQMSQMLLQKWDKDNGLPKSHSQTMVNSSRSRKQLQKGVILKKWNGAPLITPIDGKDKKDDSAS
ncbi:predicted protein [Thalassiosira pseudonana CCMP1335]|uniref:Uncharacterized protein n=1 Tax=Thalassiosira pseudonana TaxID=35128 RepID=B8BVH3_THAPS|nr:predicted protein [Thalassiosira pseudonana CCMP1335]EED95461.1 predicted protein [Thalassiosira pseudonana CCMP1335]